MRGSLYAFAFYSDSGSTCIEVALKMAVGYFEHHGEKRHKVLALDGGYHGDTFGTMAAVRAGCLTRCMSRFCLMLRTFRSRKPSEEMHSIQWLDKYLKKYGEQTAAFVFEPVVQGAAGMRMYSPQVLKKMAEMCREHGVLLIADEVMTGFGRTGTMFASSQASIIPDFMCLSKGLTGGFLPMGATLTHKDIYKAFYHDEKAKQFFHSTSFTGNPMACAAALASLKIWEEEPVMEADPEY